MPLYRFKETPPSLTLNSHDAMVPQFVSGDTILDYTLTTTPTGALLAFTAHPAVRDFMLYVAQQNMVRKYGTYYDVESLTMSLENSGTGGALLVADDLGTEAYNFDGATVVGRYAFPNFRFTEPWASHLAWLRLTAGGLTRKVRIIGADSIAPDQWLVPDDSGRSRDLEEGGIAVIQDSPATRLEMKLAESLYQLRLLLLQSAEASIHGTLSIANRAEGN